jgi:hypothetical protein
VKAYKYSGGTWQDYDDPLPPPAEPRTPGFREYARGKKSHGFPNDSDVYISRMGKVEVYAHEHLELDIDTPPFEYLCALTIGERPIRVWVSDFPALLIFLKEIDARKENAYPLGVAIEGRDDDA